MGCIGNQGSGQSLRLTWYCSGASDRYAGAGGGIRDRLSSGERPRRLPSLSRSSYRLPLLHTELPVQHTGKAKPRMAHHNLAVQVAVQSQAGRRWLQGRHLLRSLPRSRHRSRSSSRLASCSRLGGLLLRRRSARPFTCGGPPSSSLPDGSAVEPARALPSSISSWNGSIKGVVAFKAVIRSRAPYCFLSSSLPGSLCAQLHDGKSAGRGAVPAAGAVHGRGCPRW